MNRRISIQMQEKAGLLRVDARIEIGFTVERVRCSITICLFNPTPMGVTFLDEFD
jgi:hypothetical protein